MSQPTVDKAAFRNAMSRFAAAVSVVTTDGPGGKRGVSATSVCSVSDAPATLLVCLNEASVRNALFVTNGVYAVNVLAEGAEPVARCFSGEGLLPVEERFAKGRWKSLVTGAPILEGALASFDCRIVDSRVVATHRILIGEVVAVETRGAGGSLVYRDRRYHVL